MTSPPLDHGEPESLRLRSLHVLTLSCLAFAQPLLDLLGRTAEFFVIRRIGPTELFALLGVVLLVAPLPFVAVTLVAGRLRGTMGRIACGTVIAILAALIVLRIETATKLLAGAPAITVAALAGFVAGALYERHATLRSFVTYMSPALLVVPILFILQPGVRRAVFPQEHTASLKTTGAQSPIFFLVFDELSFAALVGEDGMIDAARYPNFARLAGDATWYPNAHSIADTTNVAVPAMLTSRYPRAGALPLLADHPENMFTLFGGDYRVWADEPITRLCPPEINVRGQFAPPDARHLTALGVDLSVVWLHLALPEPYRQKLPSISNTWEGFTTGGDRPASSRPSEIQPRNSDEFFVLALKELSAGDRVSRYRQFLSQIDPKDDRALYFQHVMLPHVPWEYRPSGELYQADKGQIAGLGEESWLDEPELVRLAALRYLMQVEFLDRLVGELIATLERREMYDESLIVIVADHGASFRAGDKRRAFSPGNVPDIVNVPLIIKAPGQREGAVIDAPVSTLDILPTIMDILGVAAPSTFEGRSTRLARSSPPETLRMSTKYEGDQTLSIRDLDTRKYDTVRMFASVIGHPSDPYRYGRLGRHTSLLGKTLDTLPTRKGSLRTSVVDSTYYKDHDPSMERLPYFVTVSVVPEEDRTCDLALAVNGTIVATGRTSRVSEVVHQFRAVLPDGSLEKGFNDVRAFRIVESADASVAGLVLEETATGRHGSYELVLGGSNVPRSIKAEGREYLLGRTMTGYVESVVRKGEFLTINGWAADLAGKRLASEVVVFYRNEFLTAGATMVSKNHVLKALGDPAYRYAGYSFDVPAASAPQLARYGVRVFALSEDGQATELGMPFLRTENGTEGEYLLSGTGMHHPVDADVVDGMIEAVEPEGDGVVLRGWAAELDKGVGATRVVVVFDGVVDRETIPIDPRTDLPGRDGEPLACGYRVHYGVALEAALRALEQRRARVFAISTRRSATELKLAPAAESSR